MAAQAKPAWTIRPERAGDAAVVEELDDLAFGFGRFAKSAYRLREGVSAEARLSFVAEMEGQAVGTVRFWPIAVGGARSLLLGPLAVHPKARTLGIGRALMGHGLEAAKSLGYETVILVGDEAYYRRAGFTRLKKGQVTFPGPVNPERILGVSLAPGALDKLAGPIARASIDNPVSAQSAPLG
jgi:predicted N-acetyltransferase YhbS